MDFYEIGIDCCYVLNVSPKLLSLLYLFLPIGQVVPKAFFNFIGIFKFSGIHWQFLLQFVQLAFVQYDFIFNYV